MWTQLTYKFWRTHRRWIYGLLSIFVAVSISLATPQPSVGRSWSDILFRGVQAIQLSNLSDAQEVELGKQINQALLEENKVSLVNNQALTSYIKEIVQKVARTSTRPTLPYTIQIVNDNSINAFATMGGFVYLHTGLIKTAANEAELASVIAHEIGHIASRHAIKQMRNAAISQGLLSAAGLDTRTWVQLGVQLVYTLPHSRRDELEADQLGLQNLKKAGYAPAAMVSFMQKLLQKSGSVPDFLSTHPGVDDRIDILKQSINPATANVGKGLDTNYYKTRTRSLR